MLNGQEWEKNCHFRLARQYFAYFEFYFSHHGNKSENGVSKLMNKSVNKIEESDFSDASCSESDYLDDIEIIMWIKMQTI